jgi:DNA replication protein DnaD
MFEKVKNLLKEQNYSVPKLLISNYKKFNVTDDELILLIFILNSNLEFNPKDLAEKMALSKADIFNKINSLEEKGLLKIKSIALKGIRSEVLDLEELYSKLAFLVVNAEEKTK